MAGTVIDQLVVMLGLDPTGFNKGSRDTLETSKKTKEQLGRDTKANVESEKMFRDAIRGVTDAAVSLGVVMTAGAGIKNFITSQIDGAAATGYLAHNLDISATALSTWQGVAKQMGGTAEDANSSIKSIVSTLQEIELTGTSSKVNLLRALHLTKEDLQDPTALLLKLSDEAKGMDPARFNAMASQLGISQPIINAMEQGRPALEAMLKLQAEHAAISAQDAAQAQKFQQQTEYLTASLSKLMRQVIMPVLPMLTNLAKALADGAQKYPAVAQGLFGIAAALTAISAVRLPLAILKLLGLGGAGAVAAGGAEGAAAIAGGALAGGIALPATALVVGGVLGVDALMAKDKGLTAYKAAISDPTSASDAQLVAALRYIHATVQSTSVGPASIPLFNRFRDQANAIKAQLALRGAAGGGSPPLPSGASTQETAVAYLGGNGSLSDRNRNPGNLTDGRGHFLQFASMDAGFAAMKRQIMIDYRRGQDTVASLINDPHHGWSNQWAPGNSAASTANYIARVAKALGVSASQKVNFSDPAVLNKLALAMNAVERGGSGRSLPATVVASLNPGAVKNAGAGGGGNSSIINVNGPITVMTAATDAKGIALGLKSALQHYANVAAAQGGAT